MLLLLLVVVACLWGCLKDGGLPLLCLAMDQDAFSASACPPLFSCGSCESAWPSPFFFSHLLEYIHMFSGDQQIWCGIALCWLKPIVSFFFFSERRKRERERCVFDLYQARFLIPTYLSIHVLVSMSLLLVVMSAALLAAHSRRVFPRAG